MTLKSPFAVFKALSNGFDLLCYIEVLFLNIEF